MSPTIKHVAELCLFFRQHGLMRVPTQVLHMLPMIWQKYSRVLLLNLWIVLIKGKQLPDEGFRCGVVEDTQGAVRIVVRFCCVVALLLELLPSCKARSRREYCWHEECYENVQKSCLCTVGRSRHGFPRRRYPWLLFSTFFCCISFFLLFVTFFNSKLR